MTRIIELERQDIHQNQTGENIIQEANSQTFGSLVVEIFFSDVTFTHLLALMSEQSLFLTDCVNFICL
jgi:hypothetical protein